jgi:hypothetical protein
MKIKKVVNYPGGNTRQPDGSRLPDGYNVQDQYTMLRYIIIIKSRTSRHQQQENIFMFAYIRIVSKAMF